MELTRKVLDAVCDIAVEAGHETLPIYHSDFDVKTKIDNSLLTQADLAAHRHIKAGLEGLTPDTPQLSEEGAAIPFEQRSTWQEYWLIDPLDDTKEFVNKNDEFTINIALIRDDRPVLGAVYAPVLDTLWFAAEDIGAMKQTGDNAPITIATTPAHTEKPRVLVSKSHRMEHIDRILARMPDFEAISMGSSLKFCVIAEGNADFYPRMGPTSKWSTAAGHAVLTVAGGQITIPGGHPLVYYQTESVLNYWFLAFGDASHDWQKYLDKWRMVDRENGELGMERIPD